MNGGVGRAVSLWSIGAVRAWPRRSVRRPLEVRTHVVYNRTTDAHTFVPIGRGRSRRLCGSVVAKAGRAYFAVEREGPSFHNDSARSEVDERLEVTRRLRDGALGVGAILLVTPVLLGLARHRNARVLSAGGRGEERSLKPRTSDW